MENNSINNKSQSTPFWKIICGSIINLLLIFITSSFIYSLWIMFGLPEFSYLWLIMFVLTSVLFSNILKRNYGTTIGNIILRIRPTDDQTQKATLCSYIILLGVALIAIIASNLSRTANSDRVDENVVENDYYEITIPNEWNVKQITENNPLLYCIAIGINPEKSACLFTINYNISDVPFDALTSLALGGLNRNNISDAEFKEIEYQKCKATKIKGVVNGIQLETIVFIAPSGKLSYIMAQNMSEQEFDNLLSKVHLKNTQSPYADFDEVWKQFYGDNLECNIYQEMGNGVTLEGWRYDKQNNIISMSIILDAEDNDIKTFFNDNKNKDVFISELKEANIMMQIAKNYNKSILIAIKNPSGNKILSLPAN